MTDAIDFLNALAGDLPPDERIIICAFTGDPDNATNVSWQPKPWRPGQALLFGPSANVYVAVSSFTRGLTRFDRRAVNFASGLSLMVDDVGTKVPRSAVPLKPSAIVETSPGNEQWWYLMKEPERDQERFKALIDVFIGARLLGKDPGMKGVNRVGRLPGFTNGKARYGGDFKTKLTLFEPGRRFTVDQLLRAFGLRIKPPKPRKLLKRGEVGPRIDAYEDVEKWLLSHDMMKNKGHVDPSGWIAIHCPWRGDHTTGAENAAIRRPAKENEYYGAFSCPHGHCHDKHWRQLTDWIDKIARENLADINGESFRLTLAEALRRKPLLPAQRVTKLARSKKKNAGSGVESRTGAK